MVFTLWIVGITFAFCTAVMYIALRAQTKERERLSAERMAAMEKGLDLPPQAFLDASGKPRTPYNALLVGLISLGTGVGLIVALLILNTPSYLPERGLWGWGFVLVAFGLVQLLYWFVRGRREWDEAKTLDREMKEAWIRRQSGAAPSPDNPSLSG